MLKVKLQTGLQKVWLCVFAGASKRAPLSAHFPLKETFSLT
jgi:hypothetical protein